MAQPLVMVALDNLTAFESALVAIIGGVLALSVAGLFSVQLKAYNNGSKKFRSTTGWKRPLPTAADPESGAPPSAFWTKDCASWSEEQKADFQYGAPNGLKISNIVQYVCAATLSELNRALILVSISAGMALALS